MRSRPHNFIILLPALNQACEAWKKEAEESKLLMGKVEADKMMALQQRDEAAGRCASLIQELDRVGVTNQHMKCLQRHEELESMPVQQVSRGSKCGRNVFECYNKAST